jgi:hypothetical protein
MDSKDLNGMATIALDLGSSNSAAAVLRCAGAEIQAAVLEGQVHHIIASFGMHVDVMATESLATALP